jgi:two-component system cell cycle sensor histidine kinase/response regulator CckA
MMGSISMLRLGGLNEGEVQGAIEDCFRAAQRASNLTRQLLTFSRRQPMEAKALDLNEVVANMTKMFQRLIGEHITLETRYVPAGAPINADPGMMEQALMNLAVNSRDAMPKGGRLFLQTSVVDISDEEAAAKSNARAGEYVRLSVSDTGAGIAPEHLPHIFEPFFTTKEVGKGTGLGLATVFGIVEQHSGWIDVESEVGRGTSFHVFLPRSKRDTRSGFPRLSMPAPRKGSETILVVEDEPSVRKLMLTLLERHGYRVHSAHSGAAALKIWPDLRNTIDLLITDMVMPDGVGGLELSKRLRSDKPALKVIHCSGYTDEMLGPDLRLRSDPYFLEKPFDLHVFLKRVRDCLDDAPVAAGAVER